jgi:branched-chain amino acid transport system substrate-binding protein
VHDWLDKEHVAAIVSSAGPYLNAQVARLVAQRHRTLLVTGDPGSAGALLCQPDTVVWAAGLAARSRALVQALQPHGAGGWYVLADRSPMGVASGAALRQALHDAGGTLAGEADNVPGSTELDRLMPKVAAAGARVVALLETDGDLIRALRQASRAGLSHRSELAAPFARIADIDDSGVAVAAGLAVVAPFYWDRDDRTRDFARRWAGRVPGRHVTGNAATVYAATLAFLDAAKAADDVDADKVLAELRRAPIHDTLFGDVTVRQDGQAAYGLDVYRVRRPAAIRRPWQYYDRLATVPAAAAFPAAPCGGQPAG